MNHPTNATRSMKNTTSNTTQNQQIAGFYDEFSDRLLTCYVKGNPRVTAAVQYAADQIPFSATKLLEVGCGIGETTSRLRQSRPDVTATGIDISPQNVRTAQQLFGDQEGLRFFVSDMTSPVEGGPFDVVTLLDVYEHIPASVRESFHQSLRKSMAPTARLIVTCPSFLHQNFLKETNPAGLQIVDETIGPMELIRLAEDLGGHLTDFSYTSIFRTNDYFHATIDLKLQIAPLPKPTGMRRLLNKLHRKIEKTPLSGKASRQRHVETKLARRAA